MLIGQGTPQRPTPCRRLYRVPGSRQSPFFFPQYYFSVFHDARGLLCYRHHLARATGHLHFPRCSCCLRLLRQWSSVPSIHPSHRSALTHSPRALVFVDPWCGHHPFPARLGSRRLLRPSPLAQPTLGLLTPPVLRGPPSPQLDGHPVLYVFVCMCPVLKRAQTLSSSRESIALTRHRLPLIFIREADPQEPENQQHQRQNCRHNQEAGLPE